jgi:hypothetical protein
VRPSSGMKFGFLKAVSTSLVLAALVVAAVVSWSTYMTGSVRAGIAYLNGARIYVSPRSVSVLGDAANAKVLTVTNLSGEPVQVIGYNATRESKQMRLLARSATDNVMPVIIITDGPDEAALHIDVRVIGTEH